MANSADLITELTKMASPFMSTVINLLSSMQATIEEQQQRIETLERHCGIETTVTTRPASRKFNPNNNEITLNLTTGSSNPSPNPSPATSPSPGSRSNSNNKNNKNNSNEDDAKSPSNDKNNNSKNNKNNKNTRQSRMDRLSNGRNGRGSDRLNSRSKSRGANRSTSRRGGSNNLKEGNNNGDSDIIDINDSEYTIKNLNFLFKSFKEDAIRTQGNGKSCKKMDMQNGTIQFGRDMLYDEDYKNNNIIKYRMIFDTHGSKITSGVGFGIAFIQNFNQWGSRNSGDNNSFHIRGDGKTFISDGFEIIHDSFEKGKSAQLIKAEGNLVCVELNLELFELKIWNLTINQENGINDTDDENCNKIIVKISDAKKSRKLGFIVYLGGGKSKTLSIKSSQAFYKK